MGDCSANLAWNLRSSLLALMTTWDKPQTGVTTGFEEEGLHGTAGSAHCH